MWAAASSVTATVVMAAVVMAVAAVNPEQDQDGEVEARNFVEYLNRETARRASIVSNAEWDYESNLNKDTLQKKLDVAAEFAAWEKEQWREVVKYPWKTFQDPSLRRQFKKFSILGTAALPEDKRARLDKVIAEMQQIYSTTKLRPWYPQQRGEGDGASDCNSREETIQLEPVTGSIRFFIGRPATVSTTSEFGSQETQIGKCQVLNKLGISVGKHAVEAMTLADKIRVMIYFEQPVNYKKIQDRRKGCVKGSWKIKKTKKIQKHHIALKCAPDEAMRLPLHLLLDVSDVKTMLVPFELLRHRLSLDLFRQT
ncbi:hypothetical protein J6590_062469 [Homalodisca vitripennis]|nr:hypothetical protein J6590_062469 [Homalodisca vitripennis]